MSELHCRDCGAVYPLGHYAQGCPACAAKGHLGLLEMTYTLDESMKKSLHGALDRLPPSGTDGMRRRGPLAQSALWRFRALLPLPDDAEPVTLGEGGTPLLAAPWLEQFTGLPGVYLKNETANPTWCSKDRVNTVNLSMARALGAPGVVATTTGNHGTSVVAYAARAGIPAIALCSPLSDMIHRAMINSYGGTAIVSERREEILRYLVQECGWFSVTSMTNPNGPNPYGMEGCKTVAYEIYEALQDIPDVVLAPTASGDLLYGIYKGFRELAELGFSTGVPRMIACQAEGAAPLAQALRDRLQAVPVLPDPSTIAISIGDATTGKVALEAVVASRGEVVTVKDEEIIAAHKELAANGLLFETASCSSVASLKAARQAALVHASDRVVCLVTGAATKWSTQLFSLAMGNVLLEPSWGVIRAIASQ